MEVVPGSVLVEVVVDVVVGAEAHRAGQLLFQLLSLLRRQA